MANMEATATVLRGILHALSAIDKDLTDMTEELKLSEQYMAAETEALLDVRGAIRLSFASLAEQRLQFIRIAQARSGMNSGDVLNAPNVIDQPVSPARVPEVKK